MFKKYTKEILIEQLRKKAEELGRTPTRKDLGQGVAAQQTYVDYFGTYGAALRAAGLVPHHKTIPELQEQLRKKCQELGRPPRRRDIRNDANMVGPHVFEHRFGSIAEALKSIGEDECPKYQRWSKKELIEMLQKKAIAIGKTPTTVDINRDRAMPRVNTFARYFGSHNQALAAAGLKPNKTKRR
ncbi:MAG: hypothetical protein LBQ02_00670 [Candidatus Nomurabacteria bacterium]|nr:hypothetical protein [Candidatus Nomurabacteria bacterium]